MATRRETDIQLHSLHVGKSYPTVSLQEGQHPLTGQRAANFRLLANQWAERRLVTQWRHGCRAMRRSMCNTGASLCVQILREQSYPCQYIDTTWLRYNFAAESFWATVCKTVRPMLSVRCPVCLSVTLVYCGQTVGRIKMKLDMQVGLGPGHIVSK